MDKDNKKDELSTLEDKKKVDQWSEVNSQTKTSRCAKTWFRGNGSARSHS